MENKKEFGTDDSSRPPADLQRTIFFGTNSQPENVAMLHHARLGFMNEARIWHARGANPPHLSGGFQNEIVLSHEFFKWVISHPGSSALKFSEEKIETQMSQPSSRKKHMNRRDFLSAAGIVAAGFELPGAARLLARDPEFGRWRSFEVKTRVEVLKPSGATRIWLPAALIKPTPYQRTSSNTFECEHGTARIVEVEGESLGIVCAQFAAGVTPILTVTSRVETRDARWDAASPGKRQLSNNADLKYWLRPTKLLPTDGIVKETAVAVTRSARTDLAKARAIYDWIVENTYRNPKTRGCGGGNIRFMLESKDLGGKCADLNALFVGLARAAGLPAREAFGIRGAASELGYRSLGASSSNVTKAQHCRAEVHLSEYGWVGVDPADVRKVMLEEPPGNRPQNDDMVKRARQRLFGSWEMNWIAYNFAHDVILPGSSGPPIGFLMYPQAETSDGRLDCLDPDDFKYEIASREIALANLGDHFKTGQ